MKWSYVDKVIIFFRRGFSIHNELEFGNVSSVKGTIMCMNRKNSEGSSLETKQTNQQQN